MDVRRCSNRDGVLLGSARAAVLSAMTALPAAVMALPSPASAETARGPSEAGIWLDHTGSGAIEIVPCGTQLCGHIIWIKNPLNAAGQPLSDKYNPQPVKRARPICGLQVIGNLKRQPGSGWDQGWVYDPKEGKTYDVEVRSSGRDRLTVTGYMGVKLFSQTKTWTRAPASQPRCRGATQTTAAAKSGGPGKSRNAPPAANSLAAGTAPERQPSKSAMADPRSRLEELPPLPRRHKTAAPPVGTPAQSAPVEASTALIVPPRPVLARRSLPAAAPDAGPEEAPPADPAGSPSVDDSPSAARFSPAGRFAPDDPPDFSPPRPD